MQNNKNTHLAFSIIFVVLLLLLTNVQAAIINVPMAVGTDTWFDGNTYYLSNNHTTVTGTLTIEPGAVIKFGPSVRFIAGTNGAIIAEGTASKPITFTACKDTTIGEDTSASAACTTALGANYYEVALRVHADSAMSNLNNFSYLNIKYAIYGMHLYKDINSVHDCNFSLYGATNFGISLATVATTYTTTITNNRFDQNGLNTHGIDLIGNYVGTINRNNFNFVNPNPGTLLRIINGNSGASMVKRILIQDNNFNMMNARVYYSDTGMLTQDINFIGNTIISDNNLRNNWADIHLSAPLTGRMQDNNIITRGNQAGIFFWIRSSNGTVDYNFINNTFTSTWYSFFQAQNYTGLSTIGMHANKFTLLNGTSSFIYNFGPGASGGTPSILNITDNEFDLNTTQGVFMNSSLVYPLTANIQRNDINLFTITATSPFFFHRSPSINTTSNTKMEDNNFSLLNSRIYSATATSTYEDFNFNRNKVDSNSPSFAINLMHTFPPMKGNFLDNNIILSGNQASSFYFVSTGYGDINVNFGRNNFENKGYASMTNIANYGAFNGDIFDNNIIANYNEGFYRNQSAYPCDVNIYRNNVYIKGYYRGNALYNGIYIGCAMNGSIYDNNVIAKAGATGITVGNFSTTSTIKAYNNNFLVDYDHTPYVAAVTSTGLRINSLFTSADIYNNYFDVNGKGVSTTVTSWENGIYVSYNFDGNIRDNNFVLKNMDQQSIQQHQVILEEKLLTIT